MEGQFSFKSFENVRLKATYDMELGGRAIVAGETIALFDKVQIAGLNESVERVSAKGGFDNRSRVYWETVNEQKLTFSQGVFNQTQFGLLVNSKIINKGANEQVLITRREYLESNASCTFSIAKTPVGDVFVYKKEDGSKLNFSIAGKVITIDTAFTDVVVDYSYDYESGAKVFLMGSKYLSGFVELEGTTRVKDDTTGQIVTGIIKIPHLKLMSDLSIRLGAQANPIAANFSAVGVPVGSRGNTYISEFVLLKDDIDSDL